MFLSLLVVLAAGLPAIPVVGSSLIYAATETDSSAPAGSAGCRVPPVGLTTVSPPLAAEPATTCHRQPPRARLPARLHPAGRPAESQPRTTPHWHVAVPSVAPARVVALAVGARRFCAPLALEGEPELRLRSKPHTFPSQRSRPCPYPTTGEVGVCGLERQARKGDCTCADTGQ